MTEYHLRLDLRVKLALICIKSVSAAGWPSSKQHNRWAFNLTISLPFWQQAKVQVLERKRDQDLRWNLEKPIKKIKNTFVLTVSFVWQYTWTTNNLLSLYCRRILLVGNGKSWTLIPHRQLRKRAGVSEDWDKLYPVSCLDMLGFVTTALSNFNASSVLTLVTGTLS